MNREDIELVIPVYNPPANWAENIVQSVADLKSLLNCGISTVVVCDGGLDHIQDSDVNVFNQSKDSFQLVKYENNKGKGFALREGVKQTKGSLIIYTDVDFPYTPESLKSIYATLANGADVAAGNRSAEYYEHVPGLRRFISKVLRRMIRFIIRIPVSDTQCGLKGFNSKGKDIFLQTRIDRFLFDLEFIKLASKRKLKIEPVSVQLKPGIVFSKTRISILIRESFNFLRVFFR